MSHSPVSGAVFGTLHEIFQVDAFTDHLFGGNPAAVCPVVAPNPREADEPSSIIEWPADSVLLALASENNLSETAYYRTSQSPDADFDLRWFTPTVEVQLCGHGTLATAFVLFNQPRPPRGNKIRFSTLSGIVTVLREGERFTLDFPTRSFQVAPCPSSLSDALGKTPQEFYMTSNGVGLCVFETEAKIREMRPDFQAMSRLPFCVSITAPGDQCDYVSRYFAPSRGIPEDPVTGSAQCFLTPYWSRRLNRDDLHATQLSARGGTLYCKAQGERVFISGQAVLYFHGKLAAGIQ